MLFPSVFPVGPPPGTGDWPSPLLWLHAGSDLLIAAAYLTIPLVLLHFARKRRDLAINWMFLPLGIFVVACGLIHAMSVYTLWVPAFWAAGAVKAVAAAASLPTAVLLGRMMPRGLALPSPRQLAEANAALAEQIAEREWAQSALERAQDELEQRVAERTNELADANRALRLSEERYRSLVQATAKIVWDTGPDGEFMGPQPDWSRFTGQRESDFRGWGWLEAIHEEDRSRTAEQWVRAVARSERYEIEHRVRRYDGVYRYMRARAVPVREADGEIREWIGTHTDITEEKETEEALRHTQKLESIGLLAGGIAHDFNNLLTGIMGNASLALRTLPAGSGERTLLQDVIRASERAADLTRQLLAYAGKGRFYLRTLDLCGLVRDLRGLLRASIPRKVEIVTDLPDKVPPLEADAAQIQQLLMNLVINGAEAIGEDGGTVTVRCRDVRLGQADIRRYPGFLLEPGRYVALEVADTGAGMDDETRARVFDPFFTTKFLGRGLGLAAAIGIVRGHRGAISVSSTPGAGSRFTVLLPVSDAAPELAAEAPAEVASGAGRVLLVDDEDYVRNVARGMLKEFGYEVLLAGSGREAVDRLAAAPSAVSVVLLDMIMPTMSGEETLRALREIRPDLPVIVMSGYGDLEAMRRFAGTRVTDFLQKPFTPEALAARVAEAQRSGASND